MSDRDPPLDLRITRHWERALLPAGARVRVLALENRDRVDHAPNPTYLTLGEETAATVVGTRDGRPLAYVHRPGPPWVRLWLLLPAT